MKYTIFKWIFEYKGIRILSTKKTCDTYCFNEDIVNQTQGKLQNVKTTSIAQLFKVLADENRVKISYALCQEEELCVCDIANIIGSSVATASHHLRTLYKQSTVKYRKDGKLVLYSLNDNHIKQLILIALEHSEER